MDGAEDEYGPHAVCCRFFGGPTTEKQEKAHLSKLFGGSLSHTGIPSLKVRLNLLLA